MMQMLDSVMKSGEMIKLNDVMKYCIYYGNVHVNIYMYMCVGMVYSAMCQDYVMCGMVQSGG